MSLNSILGSEVSFITFVRDYLQIGFEGESKTLTLTVFTLPNVIVNGREYRTNSVGYRDALCSFINKLVREVYELKNEAIIIGLCENDLIKVSLKEEDHEGPEAAMLSDGSNLTVW